MLVIGATAAASALFDFLPHNYKVGFAVLRDYALYCGPSSTFLFVYKLFHHCGCSRLSD